MAAILNVRWKMVAAAAAVALFGNLQTAAAQDNSAGLYRVRTPTYGCVNPRATRALANSSDPRQRDPGWVNFVINDGKCEQVSSASLWRLTSSSGDVSLMSFAGGIDGRPPISLYIPNAVLIASGGQTPAQPYQRAGDGPSQMPPQPSSERQLSGLEISARFREATAHWQVLLGPPESKDYYAAPDGSLIKPNDRPQVFDKTEYRIDLQQNAFCFARGGRCMAVYQMADGNYRLVVDNKTYAIVSNLRSGDTDHLVAAYADAGRRFPQGSNVPHVLILGFDGKPLPGQHAASPEEFEAAGKAVFQASSNFLRRQMESSSECARLGGHYYTSSGDCWVPRR